MRAQFALLSSFVLGLAACGGDGSTGGTGGAPSIGPVSFHKDVEPLLQKHCLTCHSDGQIGGFSLVKYEEAKPEAALMADKTTKKLMPPFLAKATDDCKPRLSWRDDPSLTDQEIAIFKAWADQGAPEGDPKDAPPPFVLPNQGLANPSQEIVATSPTTVSGTADQFVCVVYDPKLAGDEFVDGIHYIAGNTAIAHHALLFSAKRADVAKESGGKDQYPCFGSPPGTLVHAWAPGGVPLELPNDVGIKMGVDDVIVIQMHYHPRDKMESDQSKIQLRYTSAAPSWSYLTLLPGNAKTAADGLLPDPDDTNGVPEFVIPAGKDHHVEEMVVTVPSQVIIDVPILAVGPHMHYAGTKMKFSIERQHVTQTQPANECLIETPAWDFNWQRLYQYEGALTDLPTGTAGDTLRMHCEYNNSMSNPFIVQALKQQNLSAPRDISLGETTLDEMCLGVMGVLVPTALIK